jgi:hypothetical protein
VTSPSANLYGETLATFVKSAGLTRGETFFIGSADAKGPFMVVVEMIA